MALDTSSLFLPFGLPLADYLRGAAANQNGARALLRPAAIDFTPAVRWNDSIAALLRTTGFGELERDGLTPSVRVAPPEPADPAVPGFLPFEKPDLAASDDAAKISPAAPPEDISVSLPRVAALPLRPKMTFGPPPPAAKPKPASTPPAAKPAAAPAPAAKAGPVMVPKAAPAQVKPAAPPKAPAPSPVQTKPATVAPAAPSRSAPIPVTRVTVPQMPPAPRTSDSALAAPAAPRPSAPPAPAAKPSIVSAPAAKTPTPISTPKPPAPAAPREIAKETPKEPEPELRPKAGNGLSITAPPAPIESRLTIGATQPESFLEKIPMAAKIGAALLVLVIGGYLTVGRSGDKPAPQTHGVAIGEQGWRPAEFVSDAVGSRRGRQVQIYRASTGMSDYQFEFVGQIESKALGWVFRAVDTKNYYGMKIEQLRPGAMALTRFAVVEGRESSYSQKPPAYRVKLDVNGPRFTIYVQGEPVDFWTDNRLKIGGVGFMTERDERGASSSVQFSYPKGAK